MPLFLLSCSSSKKAGRMETTSIIIIESAAENGEKNTAVKPAAAADTDSPDLKEATLKARYAGYLNVSQQRISNMRLYNFIDYWMDTPYKWGGMDEKGIDCSAFIQRLLDSVYQIAVPRTSIEQFYARWISKFRSLKHLSEGDLIFFKTLNNTNAVSHVGLYLDNGHFVNSSSSKGVSIASLRDPYWRSKIVGAGRVNVAMLPKK